MKKLLFILMVAYTGCATVQSQDESKPFLTKSLNGASLEQAESETSGGNISVTAVPAGEARVEVYIRPNNGIFNLSREEIQQRLGESYDLDVSVTGQTLTATARPKHGHQNWRHGLSISFKIFVPKNISTHLTTSGGNISLNGLSGNQDFTTSGGNLDINAMSGKLKGRTSGGNIRIFGSKDEMDLTTSGGNIKADHCSGHINLSTSGGSVELMTLNGEISASTSGGNIRGAEVDGSLSARTSGGNVELQQLSGGLEASTSGGNIRVDMKDLTGPVRITNSGGHIDLRLPKDRGMGLNITGDKVSAEGLAHFSGTLKKDEITGDLNGGGIPVRVRSGGGHVRIVLQ